ncbi:hypothetical protein [Lysinibacillus boronitolerans]|uniref:hypothetical protein n=1 Tax=Lysinibacillus boronitolerans TaxID=309788 RepID=UPI000312EBEB|nr:hypothetical protein [Lysinibacillus boronitolerans]
MSLLQLIHQERLPHIKDYQTSLFDPQKYGIKVQDVHFYQAIFRNNFSVTKSYKNTDTVFLNFVHLVKFKEIKNEEKEIKFVCDSLKKIVENAGHYEYFTTNQVNSPKYRMKENLSSLNGFVLDFDLQKDGTDRNYTADELAYIIFNELDLYPHFIWETKTEGNYQCIFLINQLSGLNKYVMLFESIAKRLSIVLGSDFAATVANKLFRIPKKNIFEYESSNQVYDVDDFKNLFEHEEINARLYQLQEEQKSGEVINFTEMQLLNSPAIKALEACEINDLRNHACFTLALFYYSLGKDKEDVENFFMTSWYERANDKSKFSKRFTKAEIRSCLKSAFSGRYAGASKEWIESLTGHPFAFSVYRSTYISQNVYMKKTELRTRLIDWIRENSDTIVSQSNLAEILDVSLRSLKRNLTEMENEGVLTVETVFQGQKRLGSKYSLMEQKKIQCVLREYV